MLDLLWFGECFGRGIRDGVFRWLLHGVNLVNTWCLVDIRRVGLPGALAGSPPGSLVVPDGYLKMIDSSEDDEGTCCIQTSNKS
jgi:hypothetical protein